jgi:DeoR/GlpR family transcriptional regulator of sugar metabolism
VNTVKTSTIRASVFEKMERDESNLEKREIAEFIAREIVMPGHHVFLVSGQTNVLIGEAIMSRVADVSIVTNSVPVLYRAMTLAHNRKLANDVTVEAVQGELNVTTGILVENKLRRPNFDILIYSPHGIIARGLVGNRDVLALQAVIRHAPRVVLALTQDKFGAEASRVVKHLGHIQREISCGRRQYELVFREESAADPDKRSLLDLYSAAGVILSPIKRRPDQPA